MVLKQTTIIERPVSVVWPYVAAPELFSKWNDKVAAMDARDQFVVNQIFTTHYLWKRKELQCRSVVTRMEEHRLLEISHSHCQGQKIRREMMVTERIELEDQGERTRVTKTITVKNHDIPWIFLPLIWFITRFGKPVGEDELKLLCEGKSSGRTKQ